MRSFLARHLISILLTASFVVFALGAFLSVRAIESAGRQIDEIEGRWMREHVVTIINSSTDLTKARRAIAEATPADPGRWLMRYEIAASRAETLVSMAASAAAGPTGDAERALARAYAAFVQKADAAIAATPDKLEAGRKVLALAAALDAPFSRAIDSSMNTTLTLRRTLAMRNDEVVREARLLAAGVFGGLLVFILGLLALHHRLRARNRRLVQMRDELSRALEARRRFIAGVSHDFRTPLNAISGFAQILMHEQIDTEPEKRRRFLGQIREAAAGLERMTSDLLSLARLERGTYALKLQDGVCAAALAADLAARLAPLAEEAGVELRGPDLPPAQQRQACNLRADPAALERALGNLLDNAMKFTPRGGKVRVRAADYGAFVRLAVEDDGPGIPPEALDDIWDLFGRRAEGPGGALQGSGLGLAIARGVIEAHGGSISARNRAEGGACFVIHLPRSPKDEAHAPHSSADFPAVPTPLGAAPAAPLAAPDR
ncbi:sensor histidine kinase [Rhodovulum sp. DZ06]|uniref:sensor histidine kinase n=1 Tax=Rhodovulum sp. DZ06 TaxID=3425126 RepID=UPI003D326CD0